MRRTRFSARRDQDGCPLFIGLQTTRIIIAKLANSDRASLALTCSLARTTVHSEVTALDFSHDPSSTSTTVRAHTVAQATKLLHSCIQSGRWAKLEALVLPSRFHAGIGAAAALVQQGCPRLHALTFVGRFHSRAHLDRSPLRVPGLIAPWWTQLTSLRLQDTRIDLWAAQQLSWARLGSLQDLCLDRNSLGYQGFQLVLAAPWRSLTCLTVSSNGLTHAAGGHLAAATQLTGLVSLGLQRNMLEAPGMRALAAATHLRLQQLDVSGNNLREEAIQRLAKAQWPQLHTLNLQGNDQLKAAALLEVWRMQRKCPALRCLVVPEGVNAGSVQAKLAKGAWAKLTVVHAKRS